MNEKARLNRTHFYVRVFDLGLCSLALEFNFPGQFSAVQMRQSFVGLYMTWLAPVLRATMLAKGLEEADSFFLFSVKVLCNFKAIKSTCRWKAECARWMLWRRYSGCFLFVCLFVGDSFGWRKEDQWRCINKSQRLLVSNFRPPSFILDWGPRLYWFCLWQASLRNQNSFESQKFIFILAAILPLGLEQRNIFVIANEDNRGWRAQEGKTHGQPLREKLEGDVCR